MKMKNIPMAVVALSTFASLAHAAAVVPFIHYRLDETSGTTAIDSGTAIANGAYQGTYSQGVAGKFGTAVDFDGTDGEVFKSGFAGLNNLTSGFSISTWIEPDTVAGTQRIFSNVGGDGWGFGLSGSELILTTYGIQDFTSSGAGIAADTLTHVAVTFNDTFDATFFVNGSSIGTVLGSFAADVATGNWFLASTGTGERFDGTIDEFQLFDTVLNPSQIVALRDRNNPALVPEPSTTGLLMLGGVALLIQRKKS